MNEETVKIEETVVEATEEVIEAVEEKEAAIEIEPLFEEYVDFETFSKSDSFATADAVVVFPSPAHL